MFFSGKRSTEFVKRYYKFDLYIYSIKSGYKEEFDYLRNSTIDNVNVLLRNLNDNNINLFSITNHNRFNLNLYNKVKMVIGFKKLVDFLKSK